MSEYDALGQTGISACTCFNCEEYSPVAETLSQSELVAGSEGWVIGLDPDSEEGHAAYACSRCASLLVDPVSIT